VGLGNDDDRTIAQVPVEIEWDQDTLILEGLVGYRIVDFTLGCRGRCFQPSVALDALAGARLYYVGADLDLDPGPSFDGSECWIDPVVGARARVSITRNLSAQFFADVGGFGVGSDLSWRLGAGVDYRVARCASLIAGWTVIDTDYENGSFAYDIRMSGPYLGASFRF
jgi:hypothetical protein